jgi:hypothetical protein
MSYNWGAGAVPPGSAAVTGVLDVFHRHGFGVAAEIGEVMEPMGASGEPPHLLVR